MATPVSTSSDAAPLTVLIVDDSADSREMYRYFLQVVGFVVYEAADGRQALEQIQLVRFDIIITDVILRHLNGLELCRQIKHDPRYAAVPVIALTGYTKAGMAEEIAQLGFAAFLLKPCEPERLLGEIWKACGPRPEATAIAYAPPAPGIAAMMERRIPTLVARLIRGLRRPTAA